MHFGLGEPAPAVCVGALKFGFRFPLVKLAVKGGTRHPGGAWERNLSRRASREPVGTAAPERPAPIPLLSDDWGASYFPTQHTVQGERDGNKTSFGRGLRGSAHRYTTSRSADTKPSLGDRLLVGWMKKECVSSLRPTTRRDSCYESHFTEEEAEAREKCTQSCDNNGHRFGRPWQCAITLNAHSPLGGGCCCPLTGLSFRHNNKTASRIRETI